ncbi:hypothetical protein [Jatrophihabitans fulvus]
MIGGLVARLRPDPWSDLSTFGKVKRVANGLFLLSSLSMAVSAATASSDWDVHGEPTPDRRPKKDSDEGSGNSSDGGSGKAKTATDAEGSKDASDDGEAGSDGNRVKQTVTDTGEGGAKGGPA